MKSPHHFLPCLKLYVYPYLSLSACIKIKHVLSHTALQLEVLYSLWKVKRIVGDSQYKNRDLILLTTKITNTKRTSIFIFLICMSKLILSRVIKNKGLYKNKTNQSNRSQYLITKSKSKLIFCNISISYFMSR